MKKYQLITIFVWVGLSLFLMVASYRLGIGKLNSPGPAFLSFLIGAFLFLLSLCLLIANLVGKGDRDEIIKEEQGQVNFRRLGVVVGSLVLYGLLLETLGFLVVTFLLLFFLFWGMGTRLISALVASVLTVLVTYFVFTFFGMRFPEGIFKFVWS